MSFMSSSHPKRAAISEPLPCPECGQIKMTRTVETCHLEDGLTIKRLRHYKCRSCGSRFFDDDAIHDIQSIRASQAASAQPR
jgi:transcriptional regulator NrdR family protein